MLAEAWVGVGAVVVGEGALEMEGLYGMPRWDMQRGEKVEDPGDDGDVVRRTAVAGNRQLWHWGKGRRDRASLQAARSYSRCEGGSGCEQGTFGWPVVSGRWMCCIWRVSDWWLDCILGSQRLLKTARRITGQLWPSLAEMRSYVTMMLHKEDSKPTSEIQCLPSFPFFAFYRPLCEAGFSVLEWNLNTDLDTSQLLSD